MATPQHTGTLIYQLRQELLDPVLKKASFKKLLMQICIYRVKTLFSILLLTQGDVVCVCVYVCLCVYVCVWMYVWLMFDTHSAITQGWLAICAQATALREWAAIDCKGAQTEMDPLPS